jgi:vacuolar-type H+-ATPase subunit E/Vma4
MSKFDEVENKLTTAIEECATTQDLDFLEEQIFDMRRQTQDEELIVVYNDRLEYLADIRFNIACDDTEWEARGLNLKPPKN